MVVKKVHIYKAHHLKPQTCQGFTWVFNINLLKQRSKEFRGDKNILYRKLSYMIIWLGIGLGGAFLFLVFHCKFSISTSFQSVLILIILRVIFVFIFCFTPAIRNMLAQSFLCPLFALFFFSSFAVAGRNLTENDLDRNEREWILKFGF